MGIMNLASTLHLETMNYERNTMKKTSLQEQTSDPRWQRKRLEIMGRDGWACTQCKDTETTLSVHHKSYRMTGGKFADYWDYRNSHLVTLCNPCHEAEEIRLTKLKTELYYTVREMCDDAESINGLVSLLRIIHDRKKDRIDVEDFRVISELTEEMFKYNATNFFAGIDALLEDD